MMLFRSYIITEARANGSILNLHQYKDSIKEDGIVKFLWTTIHVKDMEDSVKFYSDVLELQVVRRFPARPGVEIAFMGEGVEGETLVELIADGNKKEVVFGDDIAMGFAVPSAQAIMDKVKGKGIPVHGEVVDTPNFTFFYVLDPNGMKVQFFQQK